MSEPKKNPRCTTGQVAALGGDHYEMRFTFDRFAGPRAVLRLHNALLRAMRAAGVEVRTGMKS